MPRQGSASWKKRQAELLFDDFINLKRRSDSFNKNKRQIFEGDDVVSDAPKRLSGTFTRGTGTLQSRALEEEEECSAVEAAVGAVKSDGPEEEPSEEEIRKAALTISKVGDQLFGSYDKKHTQEEVIKRLNEKGNDLTYEVFVALMSEVLPKDRDFNALCLVMQISYQVVFQLGWSFMSNFKRFISENFADEAVACIQQESE